MILTKENKSSVLTYALLVIFSVLFVLIFCKSVSLFTYNLKGDNSVFLALGKLILDGGMPYIDAFDHKGPIIFYINAIGQFFLPYRSGLFLVEVVNVSLISIMLWKSLTLVLDRATSTVVFISSFILLTFFYSGGNLTEGYSLFPLFVSMYIGCKYYFINNKVSRLQGFVLGVCFSYLLWMRLNNAGFLTGVSIFLFLSSLIDKDFKSIKNLVVYFIIGALPLSVFILFYFYSHNALYDMLYATFIFNFKYIKSFVTLFSEQIWFYALTLMVLAIGTNKEYKRTGNIKIIIFSVSIYFFCFITSSVGEVFKHYVTLMIPVFSFGGMLIGCNMKQKLNPYVLKFSVFLLFTFFIVKGFTLNSMNEKTLTKMNILEADARDILAHVPDSEEEQTYYYQVSNHLYTLLDLKISYKYFVLQEWHGSFDKSIPASISTMLESKDRPLWIVIEKDYYSVNPNLKEGELSIDESLNANYRVDYENNSFLLYKAK